MTLLSKTATILGCTFACLMVILYLISETIFLQSFDKLEENSLGRNLDRVILALSSELTTLDTTAHDYAEWDDSYSFMATPSSAYIRSNLADTTFLDNRLHLIAFLDVTGQIIYSQAFDLIRGKKIALPANLKELISLDSPIAKQLRTKGDITGLILINDKPMLIAATPILTSERKGPSRGTLVLARYLDNIQLKKWRDATQRPITIELYGAPSAPSNFKIAGAALSSSGSQFFERVDAYTIAGYHLLKDITGAPILIVRVHGPREFYSQGRATVNQFLIILLGVGVLIGIFCLFFLKKWVVSPTIRISKAVSEIEKSQNLTYRIPIAGDDEIANLGAGINSMLNSLWEAEESLRRSEDRYRQAIDNSPNPIFSTDKNGRIFSWNSACSEFLQYGEQVIGQSISMLLEDKNEYAATTDILKNTFEEETVHNLELTYIRPDGRERVTATRVYPVFDDTGSVERAMFINTDITRRRLVERALKRARARLEQRVIAQTADLRAANEKLIMEIEDHKQAEQRVQTALQEKESLLRELYHRTKNNMQVISSLLSLRSLQIKDKEAVHVIEDIQNRIMAMALVHQKLYQSKDLSRINLKEYVEELATKLLESYGVSKKQIRLDFNTEPVSVSVDTAVPFGLVLNEIITNSVRHAFPDGREGEIKIDLHRTEEGGINTEITDDGIGITGGDSFEGGNSLGLQLIRNLVEKQLHGKIFFVPAKGVGLHIDFKDPARPARI